MNSDDRTGPPLWSTTSPKHLDRLARGVLTAAVVAFREMRQDPPDPDRRASALGLLARRTQAMLPGLPDHPPVGAEAQEGFVRTALALAVHVRAHSWAKVDLGAAGAPGQDDVPHAGELWSADTFDVLGRLLLPNASPEGWTATLVTDVARGDQKLEDAVKLGKYVLHPTFLALIDDTTRVIGEALHNIHVDRLHELAQLLCHHAGVAGLPAPTAKQISRNFDQDVEPVVIGSEAVYAAVSRLDGFDEDVEPVVIGSEAVYAAVSRLDGFDEDVEPVVIGSEAVYAAVSRLDGFDEDVEPVVIGPEAVHVVVPRLDGEEWRDEVLGPDIDTPTIEGPRLRGFGL